MNPAVSFYRMSRFHSYINTALQIKSSYFGEKPFAQHIKQFFAANKKYGSNDRRQITSLCYNYFRIGFGAKTLPEEEKLLLASFLCAQKPFPLMEALRPGWNQNINLTPGEKLRLVQDEFAVEDIFPFKEELSAGVDIEEFCSSFLLKPDLFIRIRPSTRLTTLKKLEKSKLPYKMITEDCVQLPPATNVSDFFIVDKEVVIQDRNSQRVLDYLKSDSSQPFINTGTKQEISAWDCCAASGGKSILLNDILHKKVELTISDIRASIISNLHLRFIRAGIKEYKYFISNISQADFTPVSSNFDLVICDAPCTGSGTWSRTPEHIGFFKKESIITYSELQQRIVSHALPHLRQGGLFVYITCSVFSRENEQVSDYIHQHLGCTLLEQQLLKGYDRKSDSMFVAVFKKL